MGAETSCCRPCRDNKSSTDRGEPFINQVITQEGLSEDSPDDVCVGEDTTKKEAPAEDATGSSDQKAEVLDRAERKKVTARLEELSKLLLVEEEAEDKEPSVAQEQSKEVRIAELNKGIQSAVAQEEFEVAARLKKERAALEDELQQEKKKTEAEEVLFKSEEPLFKSEEPATTPKEPQSPATPSRAKALLWKGLKSGTVSKVVDQMEAAPEETQAAPEETKAAEETQAPPEETKAAEETQAPPEKVPEETQAVPESATEKPADAGDNSAAKSAPKSKDHKAGVAKAKSNGDVNWVKAKKKVVPQKKGDAKAQAKHKSEESSPAAKAPADSADGRDGCKDVPDVGKAAELDEALRGKEKRKTFAIRAERAEVRMKLGDLDGAIEDFDEVIRVAPGSPDALRRRGQAKLQLGGIFNLQSAQADLQLAAGLGDSEAMLLHHQVSFRMQEAFKMLQR